MADINNPRPYRDDMPAATSSAVPVLVILALLIGLFVWLRPIGDVPVSNGVGITRPDTQPIPRATSPATPSTVPIVPGAAAAPKTP